MKHESEDKGINVPAWRRAELYEALGESPIASLWGLFLHQIFGWPMYLIRNASGQKHYPRFTNHFQPSSIIFKTSQYWDIIISDLGIAIMFSLLGFWTYNRGFKEVALVYGLPYLWGEYSESQNEAKIVEKGKRSAGDWRVIGESGTFASVPPTCNPPSN